MRKKTIQFAKLENNVQRAASQAVPFTKYNLHVQLEGDVTEKPE
jgi:hypothetical protein